MDGEAPRMTNGRKVRAVRDGALSGDFQWLSSVLNWATRRGWKDTATLKLASQQADPANVLRVVEGA
jgi:hypothetical protein